MSALIQSPFKRGSLVLIAIFSNATKADLVARWATTTQGRRIKLERACGNHLLCLLALWFLVALAIFGFLLFKFRIAATELIIRNITIDALLMQIRHIRFIRKTRVCSDDYIVFVDVLTEPQLLITGFNLFEYRR